MELWLDTVDFNLIKKIEAMLHITGITTNPSILAASELSFPETITQLLDIQNGLVAVQVIAKDKLEMIKQAEKLYLLSPRILIKVPVTSEGLQVIKHLAKNNIPTLATAIFESKQIILSQLAGAQYAAPYVGRIKNGLTVLDDMLYIIKKNNFSLKLMAAAIRDVDSILHAFKLGVQAITISAKALNDLLENNYNTTESLVKFEQDWNVYSADFNQLIF